MLSLQDTLRCSTSTSTIGDVIANSTPYEWLPTDAPTRARNSFFGSRVTRFKRDPPHHIVTPMWFFLRRSTSKGGTQNGLLIAFLEESCKSTSSVSWGRLHSDSLSWAEASGSQKNKMTARKGTLSNQPQLTRVTPTALLTRWVLQLIEVWCSLGLTSWNMPYGKGPLRSPLQNFVARQVCTIKWNEVSGTSWNAIKCKECLRSHPAAVFRQATINLFKRSEIPWRFQSRAVLHWLSRGLCHARKCQFEDLDEKKRYDTQLSNGHLHKKPLQRKAEWGNNDGTYPGTRFPWASYFEKTRNVFQKHGGACAMWYPECKK